MSPKLLNILLLISSLVMYYYVVNPLYSGADMGLISPDKSIQKLVEERNTYKKTIEVVPDIIKKAKDTKKQYDELLEEDRKKILVMVPVAVNDIKLMSEVTNIGAKSGVVLDSMGIKDKGGEYSVSFSVTTTYTNFKNIMKYWEKSMRLFNLQSVSFSPGKTPEDIVKFNIELSTYYMK